MELLVSLCIKIVTAASPSKDAVLMVEGGILNSAHWGSHVTWSVKISSEYRVLHWHFLEIISVWFAMLRKAALKGKWIFIHCCAYTSLFTPTIHHGKQNASSKDFKGIVDRVYWVRVFQHLLSRARRVDHQVERCFYVEPLVLFSSCICFCPFVLHLATWFFLARCPSFFSSVLCRVHMLKDFAFWVDILPADKFYAAVFPNLDWKPVNQRLCCLTLPILPT